MDIYKRAEVEEFYADEKWPDNIMPKTRPWRKLFCLATGGHRWCRFLWAWIEKPFDVDCCPKCYKFRGPLSDDRNSPEFPAVMRNE